MSNEISLLLQSMSKGFYLHQVLTILGVFLLGYLFLFLVMKENRIWKALLAFPIGLSLWGLTGFTLLVIGIPYNLIRIISVLVLLFVLLATLTRKRKREFSVRFLLISMGAAVVASCIATSSLLSISVSNDTVYYYSLYPETIVKSGFYKSAYDVFLTDVGQTTALINCLPYFFGFDQTFGIQHFFNMNFCLIFFVAIYETLKQEGSKDKMDGRRFVIACVATLFLLSSTPFLITSKWVLANVYFMDFMFLIFYLGMKMEREEGRDNSLWIPIAVLVAMFSMMRMEGGIMACLLLLCLSCLKISNRELILYVALPISITQLLYYVKLFVGLRIHPLYSFLDAKKAVVMIAMILVLLIYLLWIRNRRFLLLTKYLEYWIVAGLLLGNLGLLVLNPNRFLTNLSCFGQNIILQNGWGYFGLIFLIYLLILPLEWKFQGGRISYPSLFLIGYILFTIAVCWARGATLRIGIGDSGNRVMMQVVPFAVFHMTIHMGRVIINVMRKDGGKEK